MNNQLATFPVPHPSKETMISLVMQRLIEEADYVLTVLCRMREEVSANPTLFDSDARDRIDEAILRIQDVVGSTRAQLNSQGEQRVKAA